MDANTLLFRCSSLGYLMTDPKSKSETLSETTKTHLVDVFVSNKYKRYEETYSKFFEKGNDTEEESITTVSLVTGKFFKKNEQHLSNEYIMGTPDLYEGESILKAETIHDTKSSWSVYTFMRNKSKKLDPKYYWQMHGYMTLSGAKNAYIRHCLNNTPYHLVMREINKLQYDYPDGKVPFVDELQVICNHVYDRKTLDEYIQKRGLFSNSKTYDSIYESFVEIPLKERHFAFHVERNDNDIDRLYERIKECRKWISENLLKS